MAHPAQDQTNLIEATTPNARHWHPRKMELVLYAYSKKCEEDRTLGCGTLVGYSE